MPAGEPVSERGVWVELVGPPWEWARRQLSFDEWLRNHNELDAHVTGLGLPIDRRECSTAQLASVLSLFDVLVHIDCTKLFLSTLYASLRGTTAAKVRVGYVAPGHAYTHRRATQSAAVMSALAMRDNRSHARWSTIGACTRSMLLDKTRCDARFYSMCFGDSKWHRAGWWAGRGPTGDVDLQSKDEVDPLYKTSGAE